jgi:hypothetical protein
VLFRSIVQDTINDIVVNAAVVVETIDINVQAAVDEVQIIANPNNYVVNINRIIGEQVQSDWTQNDNQAPDYIKNKPTLAAVATSGDYDDLINTPTIPTATSDLTNDGEDGINPFITAADVTAQVNSDWDATSGVAEILNKPTIPTATSDLTNDGEDGINPFITAADIPPVTGFVPYTGATEDVDLGEFEIKAGQVTLDTSPTGAAVVGTTRWNNTIGSSETTLKGGSVVLKNGVDLVARVVNKVTPNATLTKAAYQAVRVSGAQGQRLAVAYAQANNDNNSADTIGIVCETIPTNQEGFILTVGQLEEINTTGSLQGETWADGDVLYLSPTTAGRLTNIKPTGATGHIVVMGYVEYSHAIHGSIYVKIMNGWELDELHNVFINSPANNQGLFYDSSDSLWKNETIASALGYTPFQLPALTSGSVLFSNGTTIAQDNANLFWDDTNNRLGIGTATPTLPLDVNGQARIVGTLNLGATGTVGSISLNRTTDGTTVGGIRADAAGTQIGGFGYSSNILLNNGATGTSGIVFTTGGERMRLFGATGNLAINTTTDAGFKLDVNGTARVSGQMTVNNNIVITSGIGFGVFASYFQHNSTPFQFGTNAIFASSNNSAAAATTGAKTSYIDVITWAQSSGTADFASFRATPTINQTGGANGITRGLYINPTLTAAADFRAIEVASGITILGAATTAKASLRIPSGTAPTTPTNGDIWFDGTDLKMRISGVTKTFTLI